MVEVELCHDEADLEIPGDFVKGEEIICQVGRFDGNSPFPIETYSMVFKFDGWDFFTYSGENFLSMFDCYTRLLAWDYLKVKKSSSLELQK